MKYISLFVSVISLLTVIYFFVSFFGMNKKSFADLAGRDIAYIIFWTAIFFLTIFPTLKYFRSKI